MKDKLPKNNKRVQKQEKPSAKLIALLMIVVIGMFGFGFALVPLYNVFCNITGINGKTSGTATALSSVPVEENRTITVEFVANINRNLGTQWQFYPLIHRVRVHPGENKRVEFYVKNNTPYTTIVHAIPSVTPGETAKYLNKTECFCFQQQRIKAGEGLDMPLIFHVTSDLPKKVNVLTLSYTLYKATNTQPKINKIGKIR